MPGTFLDTTVVVNAAEGSSNPLAHAVLSHVTKNQPAEVPYYALRELLAGHIHNLCDVHNALLSAANPAEALLAIAHRSQFEGRKKTSKIAALAQAMETAFLNSPHGSRNNLRDEILADLRLRTNRIWRQAQNLRGVNVVQSLGCFVGGSLTTGSAGELRGPNNSFGCNKNARCSAAEYLHEKDTRVRQLLDALHPTKLPPRLDLKNETIQRRKALRELDKKGPIEFHKMRCRALGDAYFAGMCPPGSSILTTNLADFEPLCNALGISLQTPA